MLLREQRKKIAQKLKNERILKIHFHTLRHWKATPEYHKTKDIIHVMKLLGHRNIQDTMLYTHVVRMKVFAQLFS
ncbi:MAG: tyrosine-type recombinase/integrase [Nitrososphaerota archaeon]|nr:tyrosine-type recombinase/integrase [Nitrososphaerota archaeon]